MAYILSLFLAAAFLMQIPAYAQQFKSIHQEENLYYDKAGIPAQQPMFPKQSGIQKRAPLTHMVYGFHPYWSSDAAANNYYYNLLSHMAYFSAEVDVSASGSGGFTTTRNWSSSKSIDYAKANGVKVHLTITMFSSHQKLTAASFRTALVKNIMTQLRLRNGDGVNIDFEGVAAANKDYYRLFMKELGDSLKTAGKELAVCLPAVDWSGIYDKAFFDSNKPLIDIYFLMAYDYYWKGSSTAGPVAPLTAGTSIRHVTRSIRDWIKAGADAEKIAVGCGYYGYDWPVQSSSRMAQASGNASSRTYSTVRGVIKQLPAGDQFFDAAYNVPWYRYSSGGSWHQVWYEDERSLVMKFDSIKALGAGGTGIWALNYDAPYTELWDAVGSKFTDAAVPAELVSFNAVRSDGGVLLEWETAGEANTLRFVIYRKNAEWERIGERVAAGSSAERRQYSFMDGSPLIGEALYMLAVEDLDGTVKYSDEVLVHGGVINGYSLEQNYPNPFNPSTVIKYTVEDKGDVSLKVYSVLGKEAAVLFSGIQEAGEYTVEFDASGLTAGVYFYTLTAGRFMNTKKLIILK